jgi:hypothetical protein
MRGIGPRALIVAAVRQEYCASVADLRMVRRSAHVPDVRGLLIGVRIAGRRPIKALNCQRRFVYGLTERHSV